MILFAKWELVQMLGLSLDIAKGSKNLTFQPCSLQCKINPVHCAYLFNEKEFAYLEIYFPKSLVLYKK